VRKSKDQMWYGVCGGIAEHFKVDPFWIRVAFIVLPYSITVYFIFALLMKDFDDTK